MSVSLISFEEIKKGNIDSAIKRVRSNDKKEAGIYRGWMLKPNQYRFQYEALLEKNIELLTIKEKKAPCTRAEHLKTILK